MQPTNGNLMNDVHIKEKKPPTPYFMGRQWALIPSWQFASNSAHIFCMVDQQA